MASQLVRFVVPLCPKHNVMPQDVTMKAKNKCEKCLRLMMAYNYLVDFFPMVKAEVHDAND